MYHILQQLFFSSSSLQLKHLESRMSWSMPADGRGVEKCCRTSHRVVPCAWICIASMTPRISQKPRSVKIARGLSRVVLNPGIWNRCHRLKQCIEVKRSNLLSPHEWFAKKSLSLPCPTCRVTSWSDKWPPHWCHMVPRSGYALPKLDPLNMPRISTKASSRAWVLLQKTLELLVFCACVASFYAH